MNMLSQEEAQAHPASKVHRAVQGRRVRGQPHRQPHGNIRFARNSVSTAGVDRRHQLAVAVAFGKRSGTATVNEFDDASLERAVRRAEELARLAPENPEFMPAARQAGRTSRQPDLQRRPPPRSRRSTAPQVAADTASRPAARTSWSPPASSTTAPASSADRQLERAVRLPARDTDLDFTCTVRTDDGTRLGLGQRATSTTCGSSTPRERPASRIEKAAALGRRQGARAGQVHRHPRAGRGRRT